MPNWCETNISISVSENAKGELKKKALKQLKVIATKMKKSKEESKYNFLSIFFPIPKSLNITSGTTTDFGEAVIMSTKHKKHELIDAINKYPWAIDLSREELIAQLIAKKSANLEEGAKAIKNKKKYGCKTWYDWCTRNWGCKWDLSDITLEVSDESIGIQSLTAWCPPLVGITEISKRFNLLNFEVEYREESEGFQGTADIEDGICNDCCGEYDYSQDEEAEEDETIVE